MSGARTGHGRRARIGLLSVAFSLFDAQMPSGFRASLESATQRYRSVLEPHFDVVFPGLVDSDESGRSARETFAKAGLSAIVFAPTMAAPPSYAFEALRGLDLPVVIWNAPLVGSLADDLDQAAAHEHTTIISAVMLGNVLFRKGLAVAAVTAAPDDRVGVDRLRQRIFDAAGGGALRGRALLRIGRAIEGYLDVETSAEALAQLGVREEEVSGEEFRTTLEGLSPPASQGVRAEIDALGWIGEVDEPSVRVAAAVLALVQERGVSGGTLNCHGGDFRFEPRVGICACLAVSLATSRGVPLSCTGDQATALALMIGRSVAGAALYCEIFAPDLASDTALVANGGEGDTGLAGGEVRVVPTSHYPGLNGRGASLSFALPSGPCTLLSVSPGPTGWRGAWTRGEIVEADPRMGAPNAMVRVPDSPSVSWFLDEWTASGATHHQALMPGDVSRELIDALSAAAIEPVHVS